MSVSCQIHKIDEIHDRHCSGQSQDLSHITNRPHLCVSARVSFGHWPRQRCALIQRFCVRGNEGVCVHSLGTSIQSKARVLGLQVDVMGGGGGGGYGGGGSFSCRGFADGGAAYATASVFELGSGGGSGILPQSGGRGGGRVDLTILQLVEMNGTIAANGGDGLCEAVDAKKTVVESATARMSVSGLKCGGGGSGGHINLKAPDIRGTGTVEALGGGCALGMQQIDNGGGGGGGLVNLNYDRLSSSILINTDAGISGCGRCVRPKLTYHFLSSEVGKQLGFAWKDEAKNDVGRLEKNKLRIWPGVWPNSTIAPRQQHDPLKHFMYRVIEEDRIFDVFVHLKVSNTAGESIETGLAVSSEDFRTYVKLGIVDLGSEMHLVWESDLYVVQTHREIRNELTLETDVWLRLVKFGNRTFNAFWRSGPKNGWTPLTPAISRDLGPTR